MSKQPNSEARLAANRANAQRSTGPRTPSGKARTSQNATKHGLLSEANPLNNPNHAISSADYTATVDAYTRDFAPVTTLESNLIARLAHLHLRLQRAAQMEEALFEREFWQASNWATNHPQALPEPDSPDHAAHLLAATYDSASKALNLLTHYEARLSRDFARTLRQLKEVQRGELRCSPPGASYGLGNGAVPSPAAIAPPTSPEAQQIPAKQTQPQPEMIDCKSIRTPTPAIETERWIEPRPQKSGNN